MSEQTNGQIKITVESLSFALMAMQLCDSCTVEEADAIAASILDQENSELDQQCMVKSLQEYFDLTLDEAQRLVESSSVPRKNDDGHRSVDSDHSDDESEYCRSTSSLESDNDDKDGEFVEDGECELCERRMQLTKHHLIPKSTWPRLEVKLLHAARALEQGDTHKAQILLGPGLEHIMDSLLSSSPATYKNDSDTTKTRVKQVLQQTCLICRPCHSAIHNTHDNMALALHFNTIDSLLSDKQVYKFCQWANKQKPGKYAVKECS